MINSEKNIYDYFSIINGVGPIELSLEFMATCIISPHASSVLITKSVINEDW